MAQAKYEQKFRRTNVSVPSLSSDYANANTSISIVSSINDKDNDGSKCCGKCNKVVSKELKAVCCEYCSCGFTLNVRVLLVKFINV